MFKSDAALSQTIDFARITLIVGLVWLHYGSFPNNARSPFQGMDIEAHQLATFVDSFALFFFFSVVPLLSIISGWLFFSFSEGEEGALAGRIRRRVTSLYLPLVLWNAIYLVTFLILATLLPEIGLLTAIDFNFDTGTWKNYINAIFALTQRPFAFQFWFVRDLFVTVLVSPILWLSLRKLPILGLAFLVLIWLSGYKIPVFLRMDVLTFFYIGGLLRLYEIPLKVSARATAILVAAYILMAAFRAMAPYFVADATYTQFGALAVATRSMRLVGVVASWGLFQHIAITPLGAGVARYGGLAFFLHSAHFPLLAVVKQVLWYLVPAGTDLWMLVHYAASVTITVAICFFAGILLARFAPRLFALSNGGRPF